MREPTEAEADDTDDDDVVIAMDRSTLERVSHYCDLVPDVSRHSNDVKLRYESSTSKYAKYHPVQASSWLGVCFLCPPAANARGPQVPSGRELLAHAAAAEGENSCILSRPNHRARY